MPGPIPKRSDQRRRVNRPEIAVDVAESFADRAVAPSADGGWHPLARDWFESLGESGQSAFYEASDWQTARVYAELLSRQLYSDRINSQIITAWSAGATELLTTEGARRRMRIELERAKPVDAGEVHAEATVTDLLTRLGG